MKKLLRNKELSWLSFNERLLQEADKKEVPLLERLRFLGIYSNNLDEFYRVRVAILRRLAQVNKLTLDTGDEPQVILDKIEVIIKRMGERFTAVNRRVFDDMEKEGIFLVDEKKLSSRQAEFVHNYFINTIRPRIVPLLLKKKLQLSDLSDDAFYLGVVIWAKPEGRNKFVIIEVPTDRLPRFIRLPSPRGKHHFIRLEDAIRAHLEDIFYMFEYSTIEAFAFKLSRDAELDVNDDVDISYVKAVEDSLHRRKRAMPVRLVYDFQMPEELLNILEQKLKIGGSDTKIAGGRYHNSKDFINFPTLSKKHLLYQGWLPTPHRDLKLRVSTLEVLKQKDVLLHFPYHSFNHVIDLLREAAIDSKVRDIRITIYRVAKLSNVMNALINAARNGKKVTVVLELRARFDEKANIEWSERLRAEGIHVIHGIPGYKVHSKLIYIERVEENGKAAYACIGTGNFNEATANVFSDHLLCTSNREIVQEVGEVFDFFERNYHVKRFKHLLVSPFYMRNRISRMINQEIRNAKNGKNAYIYFKVNNLVDGAIIQKLYEAKKCGVDVRLNVRGMFAVYTTFDKKGNTIPAIGLIDRYLEHSRIYIFANDGNEKIYISSADLMTRNLDRRVEVATPIYDPELRKEIRTMWDYQWNDTESARILDNDLVNEMRGGGASTAFRAQHEFHKFIKKQHT